VFFFHNGSWFAKASNETFIDVTGKLSRKGNTSDFSRNGKIGQKGGEAYDIRDMI